MEDEENELVRIARALSIPAPPPEQARNVGILNIHDPQSSYRRAMRKYERLLDQLLARTSGLNARSLTSRVVEMERELASLRDSLTVAISEKAELQDQLDKQLLNPNGRNGLQRVVIAAIAGGYGISPDHKRTAKRESVARLIVDDALENLGMTLDPKTVRKYVDAGWDAYSKWSASNEC